MADALIEHLRQTYAVTVSEDIAFSADLIHQPRIPLRAVRVVPTNSDAAPLTFVFSSFPGVDIHAGLLHDFHFPSCGCDACDESLERLLEEIEEAVLAVAAGDFSEYVTSGALLAVGYALRSDDGGFRAGSGSPQNFPQERLVEAETALRRLTSGWQPWLPLAGE